MIWLICYLWIVFVRKLVISGGGEYEDVLDVFLYDATGAVFEGLGLLEWLNKIDIPTSGAFAGFNDPDVIEPII